MVWFLIDTFGVMDIVLEWCIDPIVMGAYHIQFMPRVQSNSVPIKEHPEGHIHHVNVDWQHQWEQHQGHGSHKLIDILISNNREWSWVKKDMVVLVLQPAGVGHVSKSVVVELVEIGALPDNKE